MIIIVFIIELVRLGHDGVPFALRVMPGDEAVDGQVEPGGQEDGHRDEQGIKNEEGVTALLCLVL